MRTISNFHVVTSYLWSVVSCLYGELYLLSLLRLLSFLPSLKYFNKRRQIIILTHQLYAEDNILSSLILGTGHYLCRAGEEGKKEGGVQGYFRLARVGGGGLNFFIKKFRGVSSLIARYILRGVHWPIWVKQLNSRAQTIVVKQ